MTTFAPLSSFAPQTRAAASLFVLSTTVRHASTAPAVPSTSKNAIGDSSPEIHTTLAVACRRKLVLFNWIDAAWIAPQEVNLPHQIRGMAISETSNGKKLVAGFSTGEYGIVSLQTASRTRDSVQATLGDLYNLPQPTIIPSSTSNSGASTPLGLGALGSYGERLGKATGGLAKVTMNYAALGNLSLGAKKFDRNIVVAIGKGADKGKQVASDTIANPAGWLWGRQWGWDSDDQQAEGDVFVARDSTFSSPVVPQILTR